MKRALVIEDNENNMKLISFLLEKQGFLTIQALTGREGIQVALRQIPDFVLLDIQLPDMDGLDVLIEIRKSEAACKIPVIAVTSYAMSGDRERLLAAGCDGYIEKPIDPVRVVDQIRQIVERVGDEDPHC
jgi:two-component system cell cycle response regulator DivK